MNVKDGIETIISKRPESLSNQTLFKALLNDYVSGSSCGTQREIIIELNKKYNFIDDIVKNKDKNSNKYIERFNEFEQKKSLFFGEKEYYKLISDVYSAFGYTIKVPVPQPPVKKSTPIKKPNPVKPTPPKNPPKSSTQFAPYKPSTPSARIKRPSSSPSYTPIIINIGSVTTNKKRYVTVKSFFGWFFLWLFFFGGVSFIFLMLFFMNNGLFNTLFRLNIPKNDGFYIGYSIPAACCLIVLSILSFVLFVFTYKKNLIPVARRDNNRSYFHQVKFVPKLLLTTFCVFLLFLMFTDYSFINLNPNRIALLIVTICYSLIIFVFELVRAIYDFKVKCYFWFYAFNSYSSLFLFLNLISIIVVSGFVPFWVTQVVSYGSSFISVVSTIVLIKKIKNNI